MTPVPDDQVPAGSGVVDELPPEDSRETYVRNTAVMSVGTALSRLTGFLRTMIAAAALGLTLTGDAYNRANTLPLQVYELILGGILTSVFVPLFVDWRRRHGEREGWAVADRVVTMTTVVLLGLTAVVIVAAPWITRLYSLEVDAADRESAVALGTFFLRWLAPQILFIGVAAVAGGLLNANRRFAAPMFAPVLNNLTVIATFAIYLWVLGGGADITALTWGQKTLLGAGTTLGSVAMLAALWPSLRSVGYRWRPRFDWFHPSIKRLARLAGWVIIYVVANQVAFLLIMILAGRVEGGTTAYLYAFLVFSLPHAIFVVSIFTALLPGMSAQWSDRNPGGVRRLFSRGVRDTAVIMLPAALGYLALAIPISRLLFEHGNVTEDGAMLIARTLQAFVIGLPFFSVFQLLTRTFYALQDTRTPAVVNIVASIVNVGAALLFMTTFGWGVPGLALAHAASYAVATVACLLILRTRIEGLDGRRVLRTVIRTLPAAAAAAGAAWLITLPFRPGDTLIAQALQVGLGVVAGGGTFLAISAVVRIDEVDEVRSMVAERFRR